MLQTINIFQMVDLFTLTVRVLLELGVVGNP